MNDNPEIVDILLTNKLDDYDFIYGSTELNLIFVVEDSSHPREILKEIRKDLQGVWPVNMLVDLGDLQVFKKLEIQTPLIRSYLNIKRSSKEIHWNSILNNSSLDFKLKDQDHYSIQRHYLRMLEELLLFKIRPGLITRHWIRIFGKHVYKSIKGLIHYQMIHSPINPKWEKYCKKIIGLSWFSRMYLMGVKVLTFKTIDFEPIPPSQIITLPDSYPSRLTRFCEDILKLPIVEDIVLSPALIQLDHETVQGKIFIDVVLGQSREEFTADILNDITYRINIFLDHAFEGEAKYVFSLNTYGLLRMKAKYMLGSYPLEYIYRFQNSHSFKGLKYHFTPHKGQLQKASINFLLTQFMRFRSLEHKTNLIGSRFIKSLNIIYRYQLLLHHLKGQEFAVSHSYKSILEELSPQLSHIKPDDRISKEEWKIIRAQLLFILKKIRDELAREFPSLKNLQF